MSGLVLVAPVARRAWALEEWFRCLGGQTVRPDALVFVHSGCVGDATWRALERGARENHLHGLHILHDPALPHDRADDRRFHTLARLRNIALVEAHALDADLVLSLDTDIMLRDPGTIQWLAWLVQSGRADIAGPVAFLHPGAPHDWHPGIPPCWAYNFGWLADMSEPRRQWLRRPATSEIAWGRLVHADVPMACWVANRKAAACRYEWHESGEDIGFAAALRDAGCGFVADTSVYAFHAWDETHLHAADRVAA